MTTTAAFANVGSLSREYAEQYRASATDLNRNDPGWLREFREIACERFLELGFPTTDLEDWRFTPLGELPRTRFVASSVSVPAFDDSLAESLPQIGLPRLVLVDGRFAPLLSQIEELPAGVAVGGIASALRWTPDVLQLALGRLAAFENHALVALNSFSFMDGIYIVAPENCVADRPIHVVYVSAGNAAVSHPRLLVRAGRNAQLQIVEHFVCASAEAYWANPVAEYDLADGSAVEVVRLQEESATAWHTGTTAMRLGRDACGQMTSLNLGARLSRHDVQALMDGTGAEATLNGLYLASGAQLTDTHTTIDHAQPHCPSHELYKGILAGSARGVFNGKIFVRQDAQKTDAKQTNQALLLSAEAQVHTKPQLEIFADDVKCTHGATVGQLDRDALFYLRARGLGFAEAKAMLIRAFARDVLESIGIAEARAYAEERLDAALGDLTRP